MEGAKWWKVDFHTHTPESHDYHEPNLSARDWLQRFMDEEFDCVVVSDHNSGGWINQLKFTLNEMEKEDNDNFRPITIFPGVELSVNGNLHVLAIFDSEKNSEDIAALIGKVNYDGTKGHTDGSTNKSFVEVIKSIQEDSGIAIPAHVDKEKGLLEVCSGTDLKKNLQSEGLLSIELIDRNFKKPQSYYDLKCSYSEVLGSDSHRPDHVGQKYTWVKMELPNIDALRLALHDGKDGILRSDEVISNPNNNDDKFYIKKIEIDEGAKAGRGPHNLELNFSPWLTTIIGGRGSGKSSILEYARLPFNQISNLPDSIQKQVDNFYQLNGPKKTGMLLESTQVRVEFQKDGRDIALTWKNNEVKEEEFTNNEWEEITESEVNNDRFPISIFSQKQLYELTDHPQSILTLIDKQFDKRGWIETRKELDSAFLESRRKERDIETKISNKSHYTSKLKDIEAKIEIFESEGHEELLNEYQKVNQMSHELINICSTLDDYIKTLNEVKSNPPENESSISKLSDGLDPDSYAIIQKFEVDYNNLNQELEGLVRKYQNIKNELKKGLRNKPFAEKRRKVSQEYNKLVSKLTEAGIENPGLYSELINEKQQVVDQLKAIEKHEESLEKQKAESDKIYRQIFNHEKELRSLRKQVIESWNDNNKDIEVTIDELGDINDAEISFRNIIRKNKDNSYSRYIHELNEDGESTKGLLFDICMEQTNKWEKREEKIQEICTDNIEERDKNLGKSFSKHIQNLYNETPEDIDRLLVWYPEDKVNLKLILNGSKQNIESGSAGERTAAMLSLILSLEEGPIFIDQPEDDLDTRRITDLIVEKLRELKNKQQVIIITHNPNIPVNGGAEQIIQMIFARGNIRVANEGALQNTEIRQAVCDVMEGGSEALNNRYYRIAKALESN